MTEAEINCNVHRHVAASFNYHTFLPHLILGYKYMKNPAACYWALHLASIFWAFIPDFATSTGKFVPFYNLTVKLLKL